MRGEGGAPQANGQGEGASGKAAHQAPDFAGLDEAGKKELWATLALRHTEGLGGRRIARLLREFGSAYEAVRAASGPGSWGRAEVPASIAASVAAGNWRENARQEWDRLRGAGCGLLLWTDPAYPEALRRLVDAPPLLYCRGDISLLRSPAVAVVGSRLCTNQGLLAARQISHDLSRHGVTVISGLAKGIDRSAHLGALRGIGSSIAVLGAGIDIPYPPKSADARAGLEASGLILSEYGPGVQPQPGYFPVRNRLISGLALAVVVVEAASRSGSLITARLALEQGRDVYAVPGPALEPSSFGCHELVRQGARPVFSARDVLENLARELAAYVLPESPQPAEDISVAEPAEGPLEVPAKEKTAIGPLPRGASRRKKMEQGKPGPQVLAAAAPAARIPLPAELAPGAERVLNFLRAEPGAHLDEICRRCGLDAPAASRHMICMELAGLVYQLPGLRYKAG